MFSAMQSKSFILDSFPGGLNKSILISDPNSIITVAPPYFTIIWETEMIVLI